MKILYMVATIMSGIFVSNTISAQANKQETISVCVNCCTSCCTAKACGSNCCTVEMCSNCGICEQKNERVVVCVNCPTIMRNEGNDQMKGSYAITNISNAEVKVGCGTQSMIADDATNSNCMCSCC